MIADSPLWPPAAALGDPVVFDIPPESAGSADAAVFDGGAGFRVHRDRVPELLARHADRSLILHNAPPQLRMLRHLAPRSDLYDRVWDTAILSDLALLSKLGHVEHRGAGSLYQCCHRWLGAHVPPSAPAEVRVRRIHALFRRLMQALAEPVGSPPPWGYVSDEHHLACRNRWGPQTHHLQLKAAVVLDEMSLRGLRVDRDFADRSAREIAEELRRVSSSDPQGSSPESRRLQSRSKFFEKVRRVDVVKAGFGVLVDTGRTCSFGDIPLQNIPRDPRCRGCFVPHPGHLFLRADYVALEMCSLAQVLLSRFGRSALADLLNRGGDPHRIVAAKMFGKPEADVAPVERECAKVFNFGKPAGMGRDALINHAREHGISMTAQQADELERAWFKLFPEMAMFLNDNPSDHRGAVTITGRIRARTSPTERLNTVFQGLAADGAKLALWQLRNAGYRLVNFIHDEVVIELPGAANHFNEARRISEIMISGMREVCPDVAIRVKYALMRRWIADAEAVLSVDGATETLGHLLGSGRTPESLAAAGAVLVPSDAI